MEEALFEHKALLINVNRTAVEGSSYEASVWEQLCELACLHAASIVDDLIDDAQRMVARIPGCPVDLD